MNKQIILLPFAALFLLASCAHRNESSLRDYGHLQLANGPHERRPVGSEPGAGVIFMASSSQPATTATTAGLPTPTRFAAAQYDDGLDHLDEDSIVDALQAPTLAVAVQGGRRCVVKLGRKKIGKAPLEVSVPEGRHKVVVKCGSHRLFAGRLDFVKGEEQRLDLDKAKKNKKSKKRRRNKRRRS